MNEKLQAATTQLIEKSLSAFDSGAAFMSEQIPEVINQLLLWHMIYNGSLAVGALVLAVIFITIDYKMFRYVWDMDHNSYEWGEIFAMCYILLGSLLRFVWILPLCMMNIKWLQIWIAPKIFLIEYAAKLVK